MKGRFRTIAGKLLLAAGSMVLTLLACELILRITTPSSRVGANFMGNLYVPWKNYYRLQPGAIEDETTSEYSCRYEINALGFRDHPFPAVKPPRTRRILFLGDSFTMGHGVNLADLWVKQLEGMLNQKTDRSSEAWQCINAGVNGYNTVEEVLTYEEWADTLTADIVVIAFYPNDPNDNITGVQLAPTTEQKPTGSGVFPLTAREYWASPVRLLVHAKHWFSRQSFLLQWVEPRWQELKLRRLGLLPRHADVHRVAPPPYYTVAWERTLTLYDRLTAEARRRGAKTIVVVIPEVLQLRLRDGDLDFPAYSSRQPETMLAEWGTKQQVPVVLFQDAIPPQGWRELYYHEDRHLTPLGNRCLAEAIFPVVSAMAASVSE